MSANGLWWNICVYLAEATFSHICFVLVVLDWEEMELKKLKSIHSSKMTCGPLVTLDRVSYTSVSTGEDDTLTS